MDSVKEQEYNKRFDLSLWKSLLKYFKNYKKELIILAIVMFGVGGIDGIFPYMNKYAIDNFVVYKDINGIIKFSIVYVGLVLIQIINIWFFISIAGKIEMGVTYDIRKNGFERLQELSYSYYDKTPVGWIMARMTSDIRRLGEIISWGVVDVVWGTSIMITMCIVMFITNWKLAIITLAVLPVLIIISIYFQKKILKEYRNVRKYNSMITGAFNEGIMGAKTTKTLVREKENLKEFKTITGDMRYSSVRAAIFSSLFLPIVLILGTIGTGLAIWFGGNRVIAGNLTYGTLLLFISYTVTFFEPVREMARVFAELQTAQASAERVISMIETQPDIKDSQQVIKEYGDMLKPNKTNWVNMKGDIRFKNVSFEYKKGEKILDNFNLKIKAGEKIALVGETGSGKSTIVNLACRFYEPTGGQILIDGVDYRKRSQLWLHSNLGYVLQTPHLFSGTIKENIRYGNLDATDDQIIMAAKIVDAHNFIMKLDKKYDSEVGEGGSMLSTGQKQLISFARAVLADPRIFVLDEATSSVDTETEQIIQKAIDRVMEGRTSFIIAHRLSTIRSCDRILVIKNGKIDEAGTHEQLIKNQGYYYRLYTNQFMQQQEAQVLG